MDAKETIDEILEGIASGSINDEEAEELIKEIVPEFDLYLQEERFTELPIAWLRNITKKEDITDDKIITLIKKLIEQGKEEKAFLLINSLKIEDEDPEKCYEVFALFHGCKAFEVVCKEHTRKIKEKHNMDERRSFISDGSSHFSRGIDIISNGSSHASQIRIESLPSSTEEDHIRSLFKKCGAIPEKGIKIENDFKHQNKTAFITFSDPKCIPNVMMEFNYTKIGGSEIRITLNDPETKKLIHSDSGNLCIDGLDKSIDNSQLYKLFSKYGEVISCRISKRDGIPNGRGYIQFRDPQDAKYVCDNVKTVEGKPVTICPHKKNTTSSRK